MNMKFEYGGYSYDYYLELSDRKSKTLVVYPNMRIVLRAPCDATFEEIEKFLKRKWLWMEKRLIEFRKYYKPQGEKEYVSGESFNYLGRQYLLVAEKGDSDAVKLERGRLRLYTTKNLRNGGYNGKLLRDWYEKRRQIIFKKQYINACKLFNYETLPTLNVRIMNRRWGSCSVDGKTIALNPRLIEASSEAIRYVCIHELCHIINKKHDKQFYAELEKKMPNWKQVKNSLEINYG